MVYCSNERQDREIKNLYLELQDEEFELKEPQSSTEGGYTYLVSIDDPKRLIGYFDFVGATYSPKTVIEDFIREFGFDMKLSSVGLRVINRY